MKLKALALAGAMAAAAPAQAENLSFAYFMGPGHLLNAALFTPFAEALAEVSGGEMTIEQFAGGALNSNPPQQYSILLQGVADIIFTLPGYTGDVFPLTNVVTLPDVCGSAVECTEALWNAREIVEKEYNAKVLGIWANAPPVLFTSDKRVDSVDDLAGMLVRVTSTQDVPFTVAMGASSVAQPVSVINQNLTNGVIDAVAIDPTAVQSFKLEEPSQYMTDWYPGSGSAMVLLMNRDVYNGLSEEKRGWIDAVATKEMSLRGGQAYDNASARAFEIAREAGVEIVEISPEERAKFMETLAPALEEARAATFGDHTVGEVMDLMKGM